MLSSLRSCFAQILILIHIENSPLLICIELVTKEGHVDDNRPSDQDLYLTGWVDLMSEHVASHVHYGGISCLRGIHVFSKLYIYGLCFSNTFT